MGKYKGIDEREIECCSKNPNSIESGISFDEDDGTPVLRFHFLDYIRGTKIIDQKTKSMHLNKKSISKLIKKLQDLSTHKNQ